MCTLYVYVFLVVQFSRVGLAISMYASNKESDGQGGEGGGGTGPDEQSFSRIRQSDLYPHSSKVVGKQTAILTAVVNDVDYLCCGNGRSSWAALNYLFKRGANWVAPEVVHKHGIWEKVSCLLRCPKLELRVHCYLNPLRRLLSVCVIV